MNEPLSTGFIGIYVLLTLPESLVKIYKKFKKIWPSDGKNHVAKLNIFGQNWSKCHFGTTGTEKNIPRMNLLSCVLHKHIKDSNLIKSGNAHCYNCAVIGPQIRHKYKRNLSEFPKNGCIHDTLKTGRKARILLIFLSTVHMYVLII